MAVKTFTTGEVLTAADTNTYLNNGGLVYIKSQTIGSAVSSVAVTSAFSADYDSYKIVLAGGSSSATSVLKLTLGATATNYYYVLNYVSYGTTTPLADSANAATSYLYAGQMNSNGNYADIDLFGPYLAKYTQFRSAIPYGNGSYAGNSVGYLANTTSYTDFTLTCNTGTITGGTITVYGYRKA
jgi:hypothetical protein